MKAIIFAGGVGTRLWPLSRKNSPKQFEKIFGDKSTLQLAVDRLLPDFSYKDIYIATLEDYIEVAQEQLPNIPSKNFLFEPHKRDVGPAVALSMSHLIEDTPDEPVVILWSDHLVKQEEKFKKLLITAGKYVANHTDMVIFVGQKPKFASENLGWIALGKKQSRIDEVDFYTFESFKYRPSPETATAYFKGNKHCWNLGYFVSTPRNIYSLYEKFAPAIYERTEIIRKSRKSKNYARVLNEEYAKMPSINFDNAVIEYLETDKGLVIYEDLGWSDLGAWEALKAALEENPNDNITKGKVILESSQDNLVYNFDSGKTIVGIDLEEFLVINTEDILLVTKKTSVGKIKTLVEKFEQAGHKDLI